MAKEEYAPIKFQLEESMWLDHHSRSAEIISLELEPDIEVVEERDYISITGSLVLRGRFEPTDEESEDAFDLESSSLAEQLHFQPLRVEQKEIYEEDLRGKIEKRFPLDVAVPAHKIDNLDDVFVDVEQLDYSVTDGHRLNIVAEIVITGIKAEAPKALSPSESPEADRTITLDEDELLYVDQQEKEAPEQDFEQEAQPVNREEEPTTKEKFQAPLFPAFDVAASKDVINNQDDHDDQEASLSHQDEQSIESFEVSSHSTQDPQVEQPFGQQTESQRAYLSEAEPKSVHEDKVVPLFEHEIRTVFHSLPSNDKQPSQEVEPREEDSAESQTTSFLTKLMSGEADNENQFAKLKVCIIQRDESLDTIAERYAVPVREIVRANRLSSEQVSEGQILYIPKN